MHKNRFVVAVLSLLVLTFVSRASFAHDVRITNSSGKTIEVGVYEANDRVFAISLKFFKLKNKQTVTWAGRTRNYAVATWGPGPKDLFGNVTRKKLSSKNNIPRNHNITITKNGGISSKAVRPPRIKNNSKKTLIVCLYNVGDKSQLVPAKRWVIDSTKEVKWEVSNSKTRIKVFIPPDLSVAEANYIKYGRDVDINYSDDLGYTLRIANPPR